MGFGIRLLLGRSCGRLTAADSARLFDTASVDRAGWIVEDAKSICGLRVCAATAPVLLAKRTLISHIWQPQAHASLPR